MPPPTHEQLAQQARFIFHGTVQSTRANELPDAPSNAVTVRVDEVLQGPEKLTTYAGHDVVVIPSKGERFRVDQRAIFYTNALAFGETLTLESLGHQALPAGAVGVRSATHPASTLRKRDVQQRLATADMVVVGRVTAVQLPPSELTPRAGARSAATPSDRQRRTITEHDPQWRDAVIDVERVAKGGGPRKQVVVRFPASDDVRWFRAPKFSAGDQGVFILHKTTAEKAGPTAGARAGARRAGTRAAVPAQVFTALHPEDVQPPEMQEEIGTLVQKPSASERTTVARAGSARTSKLTRRRKSSRRRRSSR
jgi:hypothetical protein